MIYQSGVNDLFSGKISLSVLQLAAEVFQSLKEEKEAKLKREAIAKKLEAITPTLTKLNTSEKPFKKLKKPMLKKNHSAQQICFLKIISRLFH